MKKSLLLLLAFLVTALSVPSLIAAFELRQTIYVNKQTLDFILECQKIFTEQGTSPDSRIEWYAMEGFFARYPEIFWYHLPKIDQRLSNLNKNNFKENMNVIRDALCNAKVDVQSGDRFLGLGTSFLTNKVAHKPWTQHVDLDTTHKSKGIFNSVFSHKTFKVSLAAVTTGLVTYYAIGFYNKDKTKEQHYSPIKWSLGAAAIVGAGTYWWLR